MIRVNLSTGRTLSFDLADEAAFRGWRAAQSREDFQSQIRGLSVVLRADGRDVAAFVCPVPQGTGRPIWDAEIVREGDRVIREVVVCYVDRYVATLSVFWAGRRDRIPTGRVDIERRGRLRLRPSRMDSPG